MSLAPTRIGIVLQHNIMRKALKNWLSGFDNLVVRIEAADEKELLDKLVRDRNIDIVLLDLPLFGPANREYIMQIGHDYPDIRIVILSEKLVPYQIIQLLDLGVCACLSPAAEMQELIASIQEANLNRIYQSNMLTDALLWQKSRQAEDPASISGALFTEKQIRILRLLWEEKSTEEIAEEVFLSISAVDKIKQQLKEKTGAKSTIGLLRYAIEKGVIPIRSIPDPN
jgi:DNA-binding NarL/FixJ family response regulator